MDQVECPNCYRFYYSNEEHRCPAKGQNSESPISAEEEKEKINFHESASDVAKDSFIICHQATSKRKLEDRSIEESSSKIIKKEKESSDTSAENAALTSSSHTAPKTPQCSLSGFASDCPDGTELREGKEDIDIDQIAQESSPCIDVGQDHSVSYDTSTDDDGKPQRPSSRSPAVCYPCPYDCERRYPNLSKLRSHVGVHTGEKKFECSECGRGFTKENHIDVHVQCYMGQVPTICDGCGTSFMMRCGFDSHYCSEYGRKIFKCELCDRRFACESSLINHMKFSH